MLMETIYICIANTEVFVEITYCSLKYIFTQQVSVHTYQYALSTAVLLLTSSAEAY